MDRPVASYEPDPGVRTVFVTRYVTPLREGGSLPAIVEADDLGTYVLKFRGAGQGPKVLIAELVAGQLARALGLPVPEIVFAELDPILGRSEPVAVLASSIVWFDAFVSNVDRTIRNTNMLIWHRNLWLIDNGATLYFHYSSGDWAAQARSSFPQIRDHVLLPFSDTLAEVDDGLTALLAPDVISDIVHLIPDDWLSGDTSPAEQRSAYVTYLVDRLRPPRLFVQEARDARSRIV